MFRAAQANPFDDAVVKATDENLTSVNWEYILDVCDRVSTEDTGGKDAVAALIKRLAHRNANVQLYTLELANALSQNCGLKIHKELASRSFTDALLRLANDRNTHQQVKAKILEQMGEWAEMFSKDADLGIMEQAYMRLKSQNPSLHPPSKPFKKEITDIDRQKEEEELQMALALSVKDKPADPRKKGESSTSGIPQASSGALAGHLPQAPLQSGQTAATVSRVRALYDFQPSEPGELQFRKGDIIAVLESVYKDWWKGSLRGQTGIFPLNYVEKLQDPTQEELQRDAQTEAEVFGEIKNVEKLLSLLSTSSSDVNVRDNEEISTLYHSTLSIRPKLIELIGKYSQKKDDFTQLNEKFIKARRDYESLLEASMSHPTHNPYGHPPQPSYGYPPQQVPPHQQEPQRYYTPAPSNDAPAGSSYPPQQNGPSPFYMIPPGSQPPISQQQSAYTDPGQSQPPKTTSPTPYPNSAYPSQPLAENRHSVAATAQELAASNPYDDSPSSAYPPPLNPHNRPLSHPQAAPNQYSEEATYRQGSSYPPLEQPSHAPPSIPPAGSPPPAGMGYPALDTGPSHEQGHGTGAGAGAGGYQAYQPPSGGRYGPIGVGAGGGGARGESDPSDFYR